jgi:hypothetical protein
MGTRIAIFLMSLAVLGIGVFTLHKGFSDSLTPADAGWLAGLLGLVTGMLGLTICGMFVTQSMQLTRIEETLKRRK